MSGPPVTEVVLASASPRRRRLFGWLGVPFRAVAVDTPEDLDSPLAADPEGLTQHLAVEKALAAREAGHTDSLLMCFDTVVVLDGAVLGKPRDVADAWRMLRSLSGRTHLVVTSVALLCPPPDTPAAFSVTTDVQMKELSDCMIEAWMALGEFMGCAGAYNIEGQVADVGLGECYQNVAGLPLCHVYAALTGDQAPCLPLHPRSPVEACNDALRRRCHLGPRVVSSG